MQNHTKTKTVNFFYNESLYSIEKGKDIEVSYLGLANVETQKMPMSDGGSEVTSVEITRLWMGEDVPANWSNHHYNTVMVPNRLIEEFQLAALDAAEAGIVVRLPEEPTDSSVLLFDCVAGVDVVVVNPMAKNNEPTQHLLAFLRREMNLPAHETSTRAESNRERYQDAEGRAFEPWNGKTMPEWEETPRTGK